MGMNRYRNYKPLVEQDGWEWLIWPYAIGGFALVITLIAGAANSATIPRKGMFCPITYYRMGEYCAPSKSTTPPAVRIINETCPIGTYTQTDYCIQLERAK